MSLKQIALTAAAVVVGGGAVFAVTPFGRDLIYYVAPLSWTGEPDRLMAALGIGADAVVADVGAGDGALIVELARRVGPAGRAFATEVDGDRLEQVRSRAAGAGVSVTVIEGAAHTTNLPDACCDAIVMRMVMHHIADVGVFARDLRRSLRSGGRLAVIDFAPGAIPHLAGNHGVDISSVIGQFTAAGFSVASRVDDWGGRNYLLVFRAP